MIRSINLSTFGQVADSIMKEGFNTIPYLHSGWNTTSMSPRPKWIILKWNWLKKFLYQFSYKLSF